jgi:hypothetical protein
MTEYPKCDPPAEFLVESDIGLGYSTADLAYDVVAVGEGGFQTVDFLGHGKAPGRAACPTLSLEMEVG